MLSCKSLNTSRAKFVKLLEEHPFVQSVVYFLEKQILVLDDAEFKDRFSVSGSGNSANILMNELLRIFSYLLDIADTRKECVMHDDARSRFSAEKDQGQRSYAGDERDTAIASRSVAGTSSFDVR